MKRWLSLLLCLVLLMSLMPQMALFGAAEGGLPDLPNLKISSGGLVTWDEYPGAVYYYVYADVYWDMIRIEADQPRRVNLAQLLTDGYAPNGTYTLQISAEDAEHFDIALSSVTYTYTNGLAPLPAPANLRWEGCEAVWDAVEGASNGYVVTLRSASGDYTIGTWNVDEPRFDFSDYIVYQETQYEFRVCARGCPNGARSAEVTSPSRPGRFTMVEFLLDLSGDYMYTDPDPVKDSEGNPIDRYYLYQADVNPAQLPRSRYATARLNLRDLLYHINAPAGEYHYWMGGENAEGMTVTKESNTVSYDYSPYPEAPIQFTGWSCPEDWLEEVRMDDMTVYSYETFQVRQGVNTYFTVVPDARHTITGLRLKYGGEIHDDPARVGKMSTLEDGTTGFWVLPPDEDFSIVIDQERIYQPLTSATLHYDTTAGQPVYHGISSDEGCYTYLFNVLDEEGFTYEWLLPGKTYTLAFELNAPSYYRFTEDATITVNGTPATVIKWADNGDRLYVNYTFTVPQAGSVTLTDSSSYPRLNLTIDSNGYATWDSFAGAAKYYISSSAGDGEHHTEIGYDVKAKLDEWNAPTGWYTLTVEAEDAENSTLAYDYAAYYHQGLDRLPAPTNLRWDGTVARWDPVEGANQYYVALYEMDRCSQVSYKWVSEPEYDFAGSLVNQDTPYAFHVFASGDTETAATSVLSPFSPIRYGRFAYGPITLTLSGDLASWDAYTDTEGQLAAYYYVSISSSENYYDSYFHTTALNLRQILEMLDAPDGDYEVWVHAYNAEWITVSKESNTEIYHYAADTGRSTVQLTGWHYGGEATSHSGLDDVFINNLDYRGGRITLNVGETARVELKPYERYRITNAWLRCGDEDREFPLTQKPDGSATGSFTVPDTDFELILRSEYILQEIPAIEVSFDETPGTLLAQTALDLPEGTNYTASISGISGPHGGGNTHLRPGGSYIVSLSFYANSDYKFTSGTTVTVNGHSVSLEDLSEDGRYCYATYSFQVSSEISRITVRGVKAPAVDELPELNLTADGGDPYRIDWDNTRWYRVESEGSWIRMQDGEAFVPDTAYVLQVAYDPAEDCTWAETVEAVTDLDESDLGKIDYIFVGDGSGLPNKPKIVEIHFKPFTAGTLIERVDIYCTKPVGGAHPDQHPTVATDAPYTVTFVSWYLCQAPYPHVEADGTFTAGSRYALRVEITPKPGYRFNDATQFFCNGDPAHGRYGSYGNMEFRWTAAAANPFVDVKEGAFYYDAVLWAVNADPQITKGVDDTHFGPNQNCTRGQVVTFLWRAVGSPEPASSSTPFTDVSATAFYYKPVLWAVENEITNGLSPTSFGPGRSCTRGQVVTFLWRTAGEPAVSGSNPFTDVKSTDYYYSAVLWAVENNVTNGLSATTFGPARTCTRGQIVTFLYRAFGPKS